MTTLTKKTFEKYAALINNPDHVWGEQEIISFRSVLNNRTGEVVQELKELFFNADHDFKITQAQQNKGTHYIRSNSFKQNGDLRKNNILGQREIDVIQHPEVAHVMVGLYDASTVHQNSFYVPLYKAYTPEGDSFEYTGVAYGQMSIVG